MIRSNKFLSLPVLLLLGCVSVPAQSLFNGQIQPGRSTKNNVDRVLGPPSSEADATDAADVFEYSPPQGYTYVAVSYRKGSGVVDRIDAQFTKPFDRTAMLTTLKLPDEPIGTMLIRTLQYEYFGQPAFLAFIYSYYSDFERQHVIGLRYLSAEAFRDEVPPPPQPPSDGPLLQSGDSTPPAPDVTMNVPVPPGAQPQSGNSNSPFTSTRTTSYPKVGGAWYREGDASKPASITQNGGTLRLVNELGQPSRAHFQNGAIVADDWNGLVGTLVNGGRRITWANNSSWQR